METQNVEDSKIHRHRPVFQRSSALVRILDSSLMVEQKCHEVTLEFISWVDVRGVLQRVLSRTRLEGSWGQVWPESGPKPTKTLI